MDIIGPERVVWRFDPLLLTTEITEETLLTSIDRIGEALSGYTQKPVISFADIVNYRKVKRNLAEAEIQWINWNEDRMISFAIFFFKHSFLFINIITQGSRKRLIYKA